MLTTQARLAMKNNQPVRLVGDLYNILEIKHVNGTKKMVATIKKVGLDQYRYKPIDVDVDYLEQA